MSDEWTMSDADVGAVEDLRGFLPDEVFDAHAHLYRVSSLPIPDTSLLGGGPDEATVDVWREHTVPLVGESSLLGGLFTMYPMLDPDDLHQENSRLLAAIRDHPFHRALAVIAPQQSPDDMVPYLDDPGFVGFKPYHTFSGEEPTNQSSLSSYLPDWAWEMADERGLAILAHLVKDRALADPENQREIREQCRRYPNAKLILAHVARGFHVPNTVRGLSAIAGLNNVWFDTAAVCEAGAILAVLDAFGPRRLLWGTDFPVSQLRGRCVTLGDGFVWLQEDTLRWDAALPPGPPIHVGLESLRALREAAERFGLDEEDLRDIFRDNALRLLGLKPESGTATLDLYRHAKQRIPGGTQLFGKRPEMLAPDQWPAYFREARGCEVWDLDGRHYYDLGTNGIGACLLGYRDPDVTRAVRRRVSLGSMSTLSPPEEVDLADLLCEIHPWAEQVRYARTGGETCALAVRIARSTTDRSAVAICGYHGWHDWYLAANLGNSDALRGHLLPGLDPMGVPRELRGTALPFAYNSKEQYQGILDRHGDRLAAVIMEPCRYTDPEPGFLAFVRDGAHRHGALLIFDEITIGWRLHYGGSHLKWGVSPDIAAFGKALGNGHPIGAVIGTREAMRGTHDSFISSTYWTEGVGPVAALVTLRKMGGLDVPAHVAHIGAAVQGLWREAGVKHGLPVTTGDSYPCLAHFHIDHDDWEATRTLYTQRMLERGMLAGASIYPTMAHTDDVVAAYGTAIDDVFAEIAEAFDKSDVEQRLKGPVAKSGFHRLI